jgi:F-type H+-transporting ATPase subunit a
MSGRVLAGDIEPGLHHTVTVAGLTFNIDTIISTVIAGAIVVGLGLWIAKTISSRRPSKVQLAYETITDQVEAQVESNLGIKTAPFVVPLAMTLFLFILIANWLSVIPTPGDPEWLPPAAADVNLTYALALVVIVSMHFAGVRRKGVRGYYHHMFKPHWAMFPINLIEEIAKPITLALRLFGNIFSGTIMVALIGLFPAFILWAPNVVWKTFDLFIGAIQAFIFALLTVLYFASIAPATDEKAGAH